VVYLNALFRHSPRETKKNHLNPSRDYNRTKNRTITSGMQINGISSIPLCSSDLWKVLRAYEIPTVKCYCHFLYYLLGIPSRCSPVLGNESVRHI
jgi:hypothetical protein